MWRLSLLANLCEVEVAALAQVGSPMLLRHLQKLCHTAQLRNIRRLHEDGGAVTEIGNELKNLGSPRTLARQCDILGILQQAA